jgi:hypothetical protein
LIFYHLYFLLPLKEVSSTTPATAETPTKAVMLSAAGATLGVQLYSEKIRNKGTRDVSNGWDASTKGMPATAGVLRKIWSVNSRGASNCNSNSLKLE